jgi:hypothetical protein
MGENKIMNFLSPSVFYFNTLKWGQSICMYHVVGYVLYYLHVCVWACQIRQLRLTIPRSSCQCVVCIGCFPRGVRGGGGGGGVGMPPLVGRFLLFLVVF